jgi:hypothetical protein
MELADIMPRLTVADIGLILQELAISPEFRKRLLALGVDIDHLTPGEIDQLRDLAGERLQEAGFDQDYEPRELGRTLESLVDKLFLG